MRNWERRSVALIAAMFMFVIHAGAVPVPMAKIHPIPYLVLGKKSDLLNPDGSVSTTSPYLAGVGGTGAYSGVGSLVITGNNLKGGFAAFCTGSLISPTVVLTAAHCVKNHDIGTVSSITFSLPNGRPALGGSPAPNPGAIQIVSGGAIAVNPKFDRSSETADLALIKLDKPVTGTDIYQIYRGAPMGQQFTKVGDGMSGWGAVGSDSETGFPGGLLDLRKRVGSNIFEEFGVPFDKAFLDQFGVNIGFGGPDEGILMYDFDSGNALNDVFGQLCQLPKMASLCVPQLGVPGEAAVAPGDSGGPSFINGQIAGITAFGITGSILSYDGQFIYCGSPTDIDPSLNVDSGSCTDSSFGEINADTNISYYANFIDAGLAGDLQFNRVPEPGSLALLVGGIGAVGAARLRRKKG